MGSWQISTVYEFGRKTNIGDSWEEKNPFQLGAEILYIIAKKV